MRKDRISKLWRKRHEVTQHLAPPGDDDYVERLTGVWDGLEDLLTVWRTERDIDEFSAEELEAYRANEVAFFTGVVREHGGEVVSNYMHMIGAGHFHDFMQRYGGLKKYSNDGWEALNADLQWWFHHCTQRGGNQGKGEFEKIALSLCRRTMRKLYLRTNKAEHYKWASAVVKVE